MKILILAAGYAIRLHPLTIDNPKPLLEVGGRKMMDIILDKTAEADSSCTVYIISNAKFFGKFEEWLKGSKYKDRISLVNDGTVSNETRHGAIKDMEIAIAEKGIDDDLLVIAGDNLFDFSLVDFLRSAKENPDEISVALHDIADLEAAKRFGVVAIDGQKKVVDFEEKPASPKSTLISTGIYFIPRGKLGTIKEFIKASAHKSDAPGYYVSWMSENYDVYGIAFPEDWCDIGDIESLRKADKKYSKKER
ncbi:MAG: nucleotidyltransferase family protein [Candidatus Omnitrophota bacterium]